MPVAGSSDELGEQHQLSRKRNFLVNEDGEESSPAVSKHQKRAQDSGDTRSQGFGEQFQADEQEQRQEEQQPLGRDDHQPDGGNNVTAEQALVQPKGHSGLEFQSSWVARAPPSFKLQHGAGGEDLEDNAGSGMDHRAAASSSVEQVMLQ